DCISEMAPEKRHAAIVYVYELVMNGTNPYPDDNELRDLLKLVENDLKKETDKNLDLNQKEVAEEKTENDKLESVAVKQNLNNKEKKEDVIEKELEMLSEDLEDESLDQDLDEDFDWELTKEDEEAKRRLEHFFKNFKIK
ncbi:MAG: hypothetical protein K2N92_02115, partial [Malacoplasma sp.]|nr:hypothetical protein [Malacoplasma sp.]